MEVSREAHARACTRARKIPGGDAGGVPSPSGPSSSFKLNAELGIRSGSQPLQCVVLGREEE